jgi:hypothetical protein
MAAWQMLMVLMAQQVLVALQQQQEMLAAMMVLLVILLVILLVMQAMQMTALGSSATASRSLPASPTSPRWRQPQQQWTQQQHGRCSPHSQPCNE